MIERIPIENRDQWLAMRQQDCTASIVGALLGVHPYVSHYGLWALKSGRLAEDPEETPPMRRGRLLEPVAVALLKEEHPEWFFGDHPHGFYYRDAAARLGATPDLVVQDQTGRKSVIQIKSVAEPVFRRQWFNDDGDLVPPLWIAVQATVEAYLTGAELAAVAPLVVGFGLDIPIIPIPIREKLIDRIKNEVEIFWQMVANGTAPDFDYRRDAGLIEDAFTGEDRLTDLRAHNSLTALADEMASLKGINKSADSRIKEIRAEFLAKLDGASVGMLADGRRVLADRIDREGYTVKPGSYIRLTIKGSKGL